MSSIKRDNNSIVLSAVHILLDIEGTTSSICFVKDVLFPYVRNHLEEYLDKNWDTSHVQEIVQNLKAQAKDDEEKKVEGVIAIPDSQDKTTVLQAVVNNVKWQMDNDRKTKCLKDLQGLIMEEGYKKGELKGHLYDDVEPSLKSWTEDNRSVYIYSSGSVNAQKLLFGHSEKGDLLPLIKGHFDTAVGMKGDAASYKKILTEISCNATDVAFFTDVPTEARAAKETGITAILLSREGNNPLTDVDKAEFPVITSFTEIEFENNCKKRKVCSETDVTNENKQVTNCAVSFEGGSEPSNPNIKSNDDVEMMEVEESSTTEDSTIEQKAELGEGKKVELGEEKKAEPGEEKKAEPGEEKKAEPGEEKKAEPGEEKKAEPGEQNKIEIGEELKIEDKIHHKENTEQEDVKIVEDKSAILEENTNNLIEPVVTTNEKEGDIPDKEKIEQASEKKETLPDENSSGKGDNKMEDSCESKSKIEKKDICENMASVKPVENPAENSKENVKTISENHGELESKDEKILCVEQEKDTSEGKIETQEKCENKTEDNCKTESKKDNEKECKENVTLNSSVPSDTNIEKEKTEITDVESNADKTNIVNTETSISLLEADKENKSKSPIAITQESDSHEKNTENNMEVTEDNPSHENPSIVHECTEKKDLESQEENKFASNSTGKENTSEKNNEILKTDELMEVEPRVELETKSQEDVVKKDSFSKEVEKSCETMEVKSTLELKTESNNSESLKEDLELKSIEPKKESEIDSAKSPIEKSKLEPIQNNSNADCKSDLKIEKSMLSEIVSDHNQKTVVSENEPVKVEEKEAPSGNSLAMTSDNGDDTQMDCETEQIVTEEKQKDTCIKDCKTRVNGDSDELMEVESETNKVVPENKENFDEKCKDTDDKVKESKDVLDKLSDKTESKTAANVLSNETLTNKEELKTETEVAPLAESNGIAEETDVKTNVSSQSQTTLDEQVSVNGTGMSAAGNVSNGTAVESQLNGSSSPDIKQEISNENDVKPIEGKKCDNTENSTPMETVVEA